MPALHHLGSPSSAALWRWNSRYLRREPLDPGPITGMAATSMALSHGMTPLSHAMNEADGATTPTKRCSRNSGSRMPIPPESCAATTRCCSISPPSSRRCPMPREGGDRDGTLRSFRHRAHPVSEPGARRDRSAAGQDARPRYGDEWPHRPGNAHYSMVGCLIVDPVIIFVKHPVGHLESLNQLAAPVEECPVGPVRPDEC